jgi:hypothetical protein
VPRFEKPVTYTDERSSVSWSAERVCTPLLISVTASVEPPVVMNLCGKYGSEDVDWDRVSEGSGVREEM